MADRKREKEIVATFVSLSDTIDDDDGAGELAQVLVDRCAQLFSATSVGLVLSDARASVTVPAATDEDARQLDLVQFRVGAGPAVDCVRSGSAVEVADVRARNASWAAYRQQALDLGLLAASILPMRFRGDTIGALTLYRSEPGEMAVDDLELVQAFADVATLGIFHQRALGESEAIRTHLELALDSRVLIEQAKGANAHAHESSVEKAFDRMRAYSRRTGTPLAEVARRVISFELDL